MDTGHGDEVRAARGVELIEIGLGLEIVGVQTPLGQLGIGLDVVIKHLDLDLDAFGRQQRLDVFQDFSVRDRRRADDQGRIGIGLLCGTLPAGGEHQRSGSEGQERAADHGRAFRGSDQRWETAATSRSPSI